MLFKNAKEEFEFFKNNCAPFQKQYDFYQKELEHYAVIVNDVLIPGMDWVEKCKTLGSFIDNKKQFTITNKEGNNANEHVFGNDSAYVELMSTLELNNKIGKGIYLYGENGIFPSLTDLINDYSQKFLEEKQDWALTKGENENNDLIEDKNLNPEHAQAISNDNNIGSNSAESPASSNKESNTLPSELNNKEEASDNNDKNQKNINKENNIAIPHERLYFLPDSIRNLKRPSMDHKFTVSGRHEKGDARLECDKLFKWLEEYNIDQSIKNDSKYSEAYYEKLFSLIALLAKTNSYESKNSNIQAKVALASLMLGHSTFEKGFNKIADDLVRIYYDEKTGQLRESSLLDKKPAELIVDFVFNFSGNKEFYEELLAVLKANKLYGLKEVLNENKKYKPKNFDEAQGQCFYTQPCRDKTLQAALINSDNNIDFKQIIDALNDQNFTLALDSIKSLNCPKSIQQEIETLFRSEYFKHHDQNGIYLAFLKDPILKTLSIDMRKEICESFENAEKFNSMLSFRHMIANVWAKIFKIEDIYSNPVVTEKIYGLIDQDKLLEAVQHMKPENMEQLFGALINLALKDQEKIIDHLSTLSSDAKSENEREAYHVFFNKTGILKNLENNSLLNQYEPSELIPTKGFTELRKYLNYALAYRSNSVSLPHIEMVINYINAAVSQIGKNNDLVCSYVNILRHLYDGISSDKANKILLKCQSFVNNYQNEQELDMQNIFIAATSKSIKEIISSKNMDDYNENCKILNGIISYANYGQTLLSQGKIDNAKNVASRILKFFNQSQEPYYKNDININLASQFSKYIQANKEQPNNN